MSKKITQEEHQEILRLRELEFSYRRIAKEIGRSSRCVYEICNPEKIRKGPEYRQKKKLSYAKHKEKRLKQQKEYRVRNKKQLSQKKKEYYQENKDKLLVYYKEWRESHKEQCLENKRKWRANNPHKKTAYEAKRRFNKMQGYKLVQTFCEKWKIEQLYKEARKLTIKTGIQHHVDHIEPLQGKDRCGLHIYKNLQILTAEENLKKGNRVISIL